MEECIVEKCGDCPFEYDGMCKKLEEQDLGYINTFVSPPENCPLRKDDCVVKYREGGNGV